MSAELSEFDRYMLRLLDRAGSLDKAKFRFARAVVRAALAECAGSTERAARRLGVHRNTIYRYAGVRAAAKEAE